MKNKISCTRKFHICAGHRVLGHEGKCRQPHGHNYTIFATAEPVGGLDQIGRVIDFSVIKERLGTWLETHWDHKFILYVQDGELRDRLAGFEVYIMPYNPTAENMAMYLLEECKKIFAMDSIKITKIEIWETDNCLATVTGSGDYYD